MAAQILSDPTAQQSVMNSLFTAFAGFTAFGAAIFAVLASGGAVQKMADLLAGRAEQEHPRASWCRLLEPRHDRVAYGAYLPGGRGQRSRAHAQLPVAPRRGLGRLELGLRRERGSV